MEGYEKEKAYMMLNIGRIYFNKRDMSLALKYYQQTLPIFKDLDEKYYVADCYKNIGEIYFMQNNFGKALEYLNESLKIKEEIEDKQGIAECFLSIGKIYGELEKASLSISFNNKSLEIAREIGAKEIVMRLVMILSDQEDKLGNYAIALVKFTSNNIIYYSIKIFFYIFIHDNLVELIIPFTLGKRIFFYLWLFSLIN